MAETCNHPGRPPYLPSRLLPRKPHQALKDRAEAVPCQAQALAPRLSQGPPVWSAQVHKSQWGEAALCGVWWPWQASTALCARVAAVLVCLEISDWALSKGGEAHKWSQGKLNNKWIVKNYHVVAMDMRGFNDSDKPEGIHNYFIMNMVEDIKALITGLGEKKFAYLLTSYFWYWHLSI